MRKIGEVFNEVDNTNDSFDMVTYLRTVEGGWMKSMGTSWKDEGVLLEGVLIEENERLEDKYWEWKESIGEGLFKKK